MTVIAYRSGIIAADSRETIEGEAGGISFQSCQKLFRKRIGRREVIIGTAGGSYLGMLFVDWYKGLEFNAIQTPEALRDAHLEEDFEVMILERGKVYTANHICRPIEAVDRFVAIGCGRKGALTAMHAGASAKRAVELTCLVDPYCAPPVITMRMPK